MCDFRFSNGWLFSIISGLCECVGLCTLYAFQLCLIKEKEWAESSLFWPVFSFKHSKKPQVFASLPVYEWLPFWHHFRFVCECGVVYFVYFSTFSACIFLQTLQNPAGRRFFASLPVSNGRVFGIISGLYKCGVVYLVCFSTLSN